MKKIYGLGSKTVLLICGFLFSLFSKMLHAQMVYATPEVFQKHLEEQGPKIFRITAFFENNQDIPKDNTCRGANIPPTLGFVHVPDGTKSFVLIVSDVTANQDHWVLFNIPPQDGTISYATSGIPGKNDFGAIGYTGLCSAKVTHQYLFTLYALDRMLALSRGVAKKRIVEAMQGHVLASAALNGKIEPK